MTWNTKPDQEQNSIKIEFIDNNPDLGIQIVNQDSSKVIKQFPLDHFQTKPTIVPPNFNIEFKSPSNNTDVLAYMDRINNATIYYNTLCLSFRKEKMVRLGVITELNTCL